MDREQSLQLLRGGPPGVEQWNRAREDDPSIPDLAEANLSRVDLMGANLRGVSLCGAFLGGTALDVADLSDADLRSADFQACRLSGAILCRSDLRNANLRSADVEGADLTDADLRGAALVGVRVPRATLHVTDPDDIAKSMRRVDKLSLADEARQALLEILQKLDILESSSHRKKQQAAAHLDDLIKQILQSPSDPQQVSKLWAMITKVAPSLTAEMSESAFVQLRSRVGVS
jgi:hypothetical protein